jgi:hypothetical protein
MHTTTTPRLSTALSVHSFAVQELPLQYRSLFEITYVRPGRMGAGLTCVLDVAFTPSSSESISTELLLRTETGPVS